MEGKLKKIALALLMTSLCIGNAFADQIDFPTKPVHLVVPFPPGGDMDPIGRKLAEKLQQRWDEAVVVENRPGANGIVGMNYVLQKKHDGHTIILCSIGNLSINPYLYSDISYDVEKDIAPISLVAKTPLVFVVSNGVPADNVQEFVELAQSKPESLSVASAGNGNITHLAAVEFQNKSDTQLLHIPYNGGGPAILDLLAERVDIYFNALPSALTYLRKEGQAKPLAVTSAKRADALPDVPTLQELGYEDTDINSWYGVCASKGTPTEIINELNKGIVDAIENSDLNDFLVQAGTIPEPTTPEGFGELIKNESKRWSKVIEEQNIQIN